MQGTAVTAGKTCAERGSMHCLPDVIFPDFMLSASSHVPPQCPYDYVTQGYLRKAGVAPEPVGLQLIPNYFLKVFPLRSQTFGVRHVVMLTKYDESCHESVICSVSAVV